MRLGSAKLPNSRERVNALPTTCTDSAYLGSEGSAWRFCLLVLAGLETRPSTNLRSTASADEPRAFLFGQQVLDLEQHAASHYI